MAYSGQMFSSNMSSADKGMQNLIHTLFGTSTIHENISPLPALPPSAGGKGQGEGTLAVRTSSYAAMFFLAALVFLLPAALFGQMKPASEAPEEFPYGSYAGMVMKSVKIQIQDCPWCTAKIENLAHDLINLQENEPFTEKGWRQSIEDLKLSKWFEDVSLSIERIEDGIAVTFLLKPNWEIKEIKIEGEYPLFQSEVLKAMSVYPGDALLKDTISSQETLINNLYKKEGYINPVVHITPQENREEGTVILTINIEPGPYYVLDTLRIRGNRSMLDAEIKSRMTVWRSSFLIRESRRLRESDLQQDVKNLASLYWQRGYPECEIFYSLVKNEKSRNVEVDLSISEGPLYEVSIKGNKNFWKYTLKKDIVLSREGNRRDRGIRKSISNMKERYRLAGYLFTEVVLREEKTEKKNKSIRKIEFSITEGPRTLVNKVTFAGNKSFSGKELEDHMKTGKSSLFEKKIYVPDVLEEDLTAIREFYLQNGFNDVKISHEIVWNMEKTSVDISIPVSEGIKTTASSVKIDGLHVIQQEKALEIIQLKKGKPFRNSLLKTDEVTLSDLISEKGHPYVTVKGEARFNNDRTEADIVFHVDEGPFVAMGDIYYRGNFKTKARVIDKELGVKSGEPFSLKSMLNGQRNIRDMAVFDSVQFKTFGLREKKERVTLLIDMDEIKPYYLQAGAGYASDRGVYGNARAGDKNLFGLNKDAGISGEVSQIGYKGELDVTQRRIFGTPINTTYALSYERQAEFNQNFGTSVWTSSLSFLRESKPQHLKTSLGFRYERREEFLVDSSLQNIDPDTLRPRGILVTTPFISYDTRDSFVRPKEGVFTSLSVDISKGLQNSFDNFLKYYLNLRYYISPLDRLTFAWLGRVGYIDPFGTVSNIPDDQLFYLGGTLSVRGYDENMLRFDENKNPVGGRLAMVGSMETRYELNPDWEVALFYDTGSVRKTLVEAGSDKFKSSVGIGMRYITPIGPVGILYGHKLHTEDRESPGRFHLSMGYTF
jgi:outer membrane protein insertion porin family